MEDRLTAIILTLTIMIVEEELTMDVAVPGGVAGVADADERVAEAETIPPLTPVKEQ